MTRSWTRQGSENQGLRQRSEWSPERWRVQLQRISLINWFCFLFVACLGYAEAADDAGVAFGRSIAIAVSPDKQSAYISGSTDGQLYRISASALELQAVELAEWVDPAQPKRSVVDLQLTDTGQYLFALTNQPPGLCIWSADNLADKPTVVPLEGQLARLALGQGMHGQQFACITATQARSIYAVTFEVDQGQIRVKADRISLDFMPQSVVHLGDERFCVADAFGGNLIVVRAGEARVESVHKIDGYHIGGLAVDANRQQLLITHQQLSRNAHTTRDDIHWGTLIKNTVSIIALDALVGANKRLPARPYRLGRVGKGAADPAGIVASGDQRAVAISSSDELAILGSGNQPPKFVPVGSVPSQVVAFGKSRLLCINRLDQTISVVDLESDEPQEIKRIGRASSPLSDRERGERAFYSGALSHDGWMSCNSCHIEGHSPDLMVDTLSDGTYGTPKRIPSLTGVGHTGPWSWTGVHTTLEEQLEKTLSSTMHAPNSSVKNSVKELIAYLTEPADATADTHAPVQEPPAVFHSRCARCHNPDTHFTSAGTYDVGLQDELGQRQFNPPSLSGVAQRQRFMHDGRYNSLEQLLSEHPQRATAAEVQELIQFLRNDPDPL